MPIFKCLALAGTVASMALAGASTATELTFIDGGYAEMCSSIAHNLDGRERVELTGSRMSIPPLEICTLAIEDEASAPLNKAASYNNRGVIYFDEGKYAEALGDFDRALVLMDTLAAAHINRGYTLVAQKRWADSLPSFDRGIELGAPDPARAHFNRGIAHEELGHVRDAYYDYKRASELDPLWEEPKRELERFQVR
jgi:tetratricopeptide (TPR) repeat protein